MQVLVWGMEEWAWNVYPSTVVSSLCVVGVYAGVLGGVWWNWGREVERERGRFEVIMMMERRR